MNEAANMATNESASTIRDQQRAHALHHAVEVTKVCCDGDPDVVLKRAEAFDAFLTGASGKPSHDTSGQPKLTTQELLSLAHGRIVAALTARTGDREAIDAAITALVAARDSIPDQTETVAMGDGQFRHPLNETAGGIVGAQAQPAAEKSERPFGAAQGQAEPDPFTAHARMVRLYTAAALEDVRVKHFAAHPTSSDCADSLIEGLRTRGLKIVRA